VRQNQGSRGDPLLREQGSPEPISEREPTVQALREAKIGSTNISSSTNMSMERYVGIGATSGNADA
jgi:hypothetical protein